ncbi:MAG: endonuclease [Omnitrophica WOR_2 bacterium SM23_72]|nr:MAG: endonuclease [Omnitrophica WOR_2 bacterium SM23_72]
MRKASQKKKLYSIYLKLFASFGPQHWWPAKTPFEVMVGAILTQNTNWANVEKAIAQLKQHKALAPKRIYHLSTSKLARLIKSAGYYNIKTKRLKAFLKFLFDHYRGEPNRMSRVPGQKLRSQFLSINGIGPETADSILLYALQKPLFVIDAYTKRIMARHGFIAEDCSYKDVQNLFMQNLKKEVKLFNEYHALLVRLGKEFCLKKNPKCRICPLK